MTRTTWNPLAYLQHAWSQLSTVWGKIGLVLFYSFLWLTIFSAVWSIISPNSQGMDCIIDDLNAWSQALFVWMHRSFNIFLLGFLLYADTKGLHTKNVAFVALFAAGCLWSTHAGFRVLGNTNAAKYDAEAECFRPLLTAAWVWFGWVLGALVCVVMEEKLGDHGSEDERQPLSS